MVRIDLNTSKNGAQECKSNNEVNPKTETKITTQTLVLNQILLLKNYLKRNKVKN